jgi:uncharacterized membrane protein
MKPYWIYIIGIIIILIVNDNFFSSWTDYPTNPFTLIGLLKSMVVIVPESIILAFIFLAYRRCYTKPKNTNS